MLVSELIDGPQSNVALNVRRGHTEIDDSKARSLIDWIEQQPNKHKIITAINDLNKNFFVTNWSRFPIYKLDFGYGTPIKFRTQRNKSHPGSSIIIGTPADDGGLEVYVNLSSEHMKKLEQDHEFITITGHVTNDTHH
jgi:shikimate O-hydroxycinnamoyltransferase